MKKIFYVLTAVSLMGSCTVQKPLYTWDNYEVTSYNYVKNSDEKSTQALIETYQTIIERQKGSRGVVPPGVYADYGFVLLQKDKTEEGRAMLLKEVNLYPESKTFIDRILKIIEK